MPTRLHQAIAVAAIGVLAVLAAAPAEAQFHATDPRAAAELLDLEQQRAETSLVGPIVMSAVGVHMFAVGVTFALDATALSADVCRDDSSAFESCVSRRQVRAFGIASGASVAVAAPLLGFGIPWFVRRLRKRRELGHRIRQLRTPVTLGALDLRLGSGRAEAVATFAF